MSYIDVVILLLASAILKQGSTNNTGTAPQYGLDPCLLPNTV